MDTRVLSIVLSLAVLVFIVELVRREKLTFKYAVGWMSASLCAMLLAVFNQFLDRIAAFFGFELTSNFIFFAILCAFVFLSLMLTIFLCQQNNRNDKIAQKIGLLEHEVEELKKK